MRKRFKASDEEVKDYIKNNWYYDDVKCKICWLKDSDELKFYVNKLGYLQKYITVKPCTIRLIWYHQIIYFLFTGEFNTDLKINHKNGIVSDNNISNLELITNQENCAYRTKLNKNNKSGYHGIHWHKRDQRWIAEIAINGKNKQIGYYLTLEEAVTARDKYIIDNKLDYYPTSTTFNKPK
jgi:hypothetical protein